MDAANIYTPHIVNPPNYSNQSIKKIEKSIKQYSKLLSDEPSKASKIKPNKPVGRIYLQNTNTTCRDDATGAQVPRYAIINVRKDTGFIQSAMADLVTATSSAMNYADQNSSSKCMKTTIMEVNELGKELQNSQYISLADLRAADSSLFPGGKKPSIPEGFDVIAANDDYEITLDAGQRFFVGSCAVLALYMYYKLVYGKR